MASSTSPQATDLEAAAEDHYFSTNPAPKDLEQHISLARDFINFHASEGRRVVLITSGGTTVPLEKQTVRFIDNFSAGTRGATSAEHFLEAGYAVIFLHRQFSLLPYSRHYSHATDCFLDLLSEGAGRAAQDGSGVVGGGRIEVKAEYRDKMLDVLRRYRSATERNMLLTLPFVTITDYLYELRAVAQLMRPLGPRALLYLAAAVSDFFVPPERMSEHKIQSTNAVDGVAKTGGSKQQGQRTAAEEEEDEQEEEEFDNFDSSPAVPRSKRLIVDLDPVPKFLKNVVNDWASQGMIVSFKLETDPDILVHKAKYSLERYQHHLVIGNLLTTRKWEVVFVTASQRDRWIRVPLNRRKKTISGVEELVGAAEEGLNNTTTTTTTSSARSNIVGDDKPLDPSTLPDRDPEMEIESLIIPAVEELHSRHIAEKQQAESAAR